MAIKEPAFMRDLHKIREEIYKETKGLSVEEEVEWFHKEAEKALQEQGYRIKPTDKGYRIVKNK